MITSVSDPDAVAEVEAPGNGFVRALVFDSSEVGFKTLFISSSGSNAKTVFCSPLHFSLSSNLSKLR